MDKRAALKQYFGHSAFRPGQEALIDALLAGRDVLGVMPTGAGKSVCYQIPALLSEGLTLVISPLISLMKDQVAALAQAGIPAAFLNSSLTGRAYADVLRQAEAGRYKMLYVAPERLEAEGFQALAERADISLLAVDEAHCVSQWGQDFRPSYLKIPEFVAKLPRRPAVGAFTATATAEVREDINRMLGLRAPLCLTTGFDRPNLSFAVERPKDKAAWLVAFLVSQPDKSGIIYCATRKTVEAVCGALEAQGISATRYHAGLEDGERRKNQEDFVYDRAKIMVATNAFGMGIDKSNVGFVVHYNMPKNLESYYQEAGRAGRDGEAAACILLFSEGDVQTAKFLLQNGGDGEEADPEIRAALLRRDLDRLNRMTGYCKTKKCLRGYLLSYFGETYQGLCGNCGNCTGEFVLRDITVEAQKILSGVARVEKRFSYSLGAAVITQMLRGSKEQRVLQLGLDKLPTYGIMQDVSRPQLREYLDYLTAEGYLLATAGEFPVLRLGPRARDVLFHKAAVQMPVRAGLEPPPPEVRRPEKSAGLSPVDAPLLAALKALRTELAQGENVPAYIVFSNATLSDMAHRRPRSMAELLAVSGVGEVKAAKYGRRFLDVLLEFEERA